MDAQEEKSKEALTGPAADKADARRRKLIAKGRGSLGGDRVIRLAEWLGDWNITVEGDRTKGCNKR